MADYGVISHPFLLVALFARVRQRAVFRFWDEWQTIFSLYNCQNAQTIFYYARTVLSLLVMTEKKFAKLALLIIAYEFIIRAAVCQIRQSSIVNRLKKLFYLIKIK